MVVGLNEQDTVLALGYKPVATSEWYGGQPYAVWPWARAALGDTKPTVLDNGDGFGFERIAALRPDLILGVNSGMRQGDYERLSQLAAHDRPRQGQHPLLLPVGPADRADRGRPGQAARGS